MSLNLNLTDDVALITGVTSGIGAGVAKQLARAGCHLAGCGLEARDHPGARRFLDLAGNRDRGVLYRQADVTDEGALKAFVEETGEKFGAVDVLVSNAGKNIFGGVEDCDLDTWQECLDLDLKAHWRLCQMAKPWMDRAEDPVILVMSSNHADYTVPGVFPYNVAKAGLRSLVQSIAVEWGPKYRAVAIAPGFIDTPINESWFESFEDPEAERRRTERRHPVGKLGTPGEIGGLCAFLASEYAGFITGTTVLADGGRSALMQDEKRFVREDPPGNEPNDPRP